MYKLLIRCIISDSYVNGFNLKTIAYPPIFPRSRFSLPGNIPGWLSQLYNDFGNIIIWVPKIKSVKK